MKWTSQFKRFLISGLLACPLFAQAAIPLSVYQSLIVPLPVKYANQGYFWGLEGGLPTISDIEFMGAINEKDLMAMPSPVMPFKGNIAYKLDTGFMGGITFGYRHTYLRFEAEAVGYTTTIGNIKGLPANRFNVTLANPDDDFGNFLAIGLFGNVLLDLHITGTGLFPILGLGIGGLYLDYDPTVKNSCASGETDLKNSSFQFAFQVIAGIGLTFTDHIEADVAFKYITTKMSNYNVKTPACSAKTSPPEVTFFLKRDGTITFSTFVVELRFS